MLEKLHGHVPKSNKRKNLTDGIDDGFEILTGSITGLRVMLCESSEFNGTQTNVHAYWYK